MTGYRVLVVDDDESIRAVLGFQLEELGLDVTLAASAEEAWKLFEGDSHDLVVTDVRMSGMSGLELLDRLRGRDPEPLVIVMTAYGSVRQAVDAMKRGAHDYLTKPFDRDSVRLAVRKAIEFAKIRSENTALRRELRDRYSFSNLVGRSAAMEQVFRVLSRVAPSDATVLIEGETGTGKELIARALHYASRRNSAKFITVNCAAIPRELLESELFGHEKGSFTGATRAKTGKFELADGGTIFLDEVGEIELDLQKKLLRVLQEREVDRVGAAEPVPVDVRVVAATNRSLAELVEAGEFRKDLYYRLSVVPVRIPALRERRDDIPLLVEHFLRKHGGADVAFSEAVLAELVTRDWPGNVRELENTIERLLVLRRSPGRIDEQDLRECEAAFVPPAVESAALEIPAGGVVLGDVEKQLIESALRKAHGNQSKAARLLGISRQTLLYRLKKHAIPMSRDAQVDDGGAAP